MTQVSLGILFQKVVNQFSDSVAIEFTSGDKYTYDQLNKYVNQTSRLLRENYKISPQDVVCISGLKKIETFCVMLACLKIGAIYSIFDNTSPINRLLNIFKTCQPKLILAENELIKSFKNSSQLLEVKTLKNDFIEIGLLKGYDDKNLRKSMNLNLNSAAYIMFTSGSTGTPKGAMISHANLISFISWSIKEYGFSASDKLTNVNPLYFDNSVFDFYSALFSGASIVPFSKNEVSNPSLLIQEINRIGCTSWFSVPSLLIYLETINILKSENMIKIKRFIFGGEAYPKSKLIKLFQLYSHRAELYNVYGPTECTCICSTYKISDKDFDDMSGLAPLGKLIENFNYLILNSQLRQVKENDIGELCLLGKNVGLGYYNDIKQTNKNFIQNPLNTINSELMYMTGDLVKYDSNTGYINFICRKDNQIKHMGYRIELDEIEHALNQIDEISESVAVQASLNEIKIIVAYVSLKKNSELDSNEIKTRLRENIPIYMVPSKIKFLDVLPKNANGKIDRPQIIKNYLLN